MTPEQYRREQRAVIVRLLDFLLPILQLLPARPSDADWRAFVDALYPVTVRSRAEAWRLAERFYREQRRTQGAAEGPVEFPRRNYPVEALDRALTRSARARLRELDRGQAVPEVVRQEATATVVRHVENAGRQAIVDAARHDPQALGYARVPSAACKCAFCLTLASRGPVYKSASSALLRDGTGEPYHDHCRCLAVPVFDRDDWPGRDRYLAADRLWREAGRSLNGLRRHLDRQEQTEQPAEQAA